MVYRLAPNTAWIGKKSIRKAALQYFDTTWREVRQEVLERDDHQCQECGEAENLEVHHLISVRANPYLVADLNNLVTLCKSCHSEARRPRMKIHCTWCGKEMKRKAFSFRCGLWLCWSCDDEFIEEST